MRKMVKHGMTVCERQYCLGLAYVLVVCFVVFFSSCEKVIIEEDEEKKEQITKNNDPNRNGDDSNSDGDSWDWGDEDNDSTIDTDRDTPYLETDIKDGNDHPSDGVNADVAISVTQFLARSVGTCCTVEGYIVAACANSALKPENVDFEPPFRWSSAILLADGMNERDVHKMMSVQLKSGSAIRKALDPDVHPEIHGKRLQVTGYRESYLGIVGMKGIGSGDFVLLE